MQVSITAGSTQGKKTKTRTTKERNKQNVQIKLQQSFHFSFFFFFFNKNSFSSSYILESNLLILSKAGKVPSARARNSSKLHFHSTSGLSNSQIRHIPSTTLQQMYHPHRSSTQKQALPWENRARPPKKNKIKINQKENVILQLGILTVSQSSINPPHLPKLRQEIAARKGRRRKEPLMKHQLQSN